MIIEGRHADVGSGIFISDIQRESVAEEVSPIQSKAKTILDEMITTRKKKIIISQAGLAVGDMILCVNKDELLGADYDTVRKIKMAALIVDIFLGHLC